MNKNFRCTGVCANCGRCKGANMMQRANERKTKLLTFPEDFSPNKGNNGFGIAFDIGTTTVVGVLWDLTKGEQVGTIAKTNPQNAYGSDVISRITYCGGKDDKIEELRNLVIECLNQILDALCKKHSIDSTQIVKVTVCGNTTMSHIFAGFDPMSLALAPFIPAYEGEVIMTGEEARLKIDPSAKVFLIPNIAGHVGGDINAGIIASRLLNKKELTLFIDIGTNGEIVLSKDSTTLTCSTAAGPAFEGASIKHGMRAASGAIEKIEIREDDVFFKTIDECEPVGICGSGLIDAVAQMLKIQLINKKGRLVSAEEYLKKQPKSDLGYRLRNDVEGNREFVLVFKEGKEDVVITQKDVREVQLAKGAISAGIQIMLEELDEKIDNIDKVMIAGAFGNFIDKESAIAIGLIPPVELNKIHLMGNTAGSGTCMVLVSEEEEGLSVNIPEDVKHIELASCKHFQERYLKAMLFI
ncbi:MAG: ASKHA domain-containing protein [Anaerovorax sp.]|nr:ASKHA domain-containing protein [Anaerovorax sp.]